MTIRRIIIDNFRSIQHLDLPLVELNALIGPNNSGKSNILRAINLVLGEAWPTRPFTDRDFHQNNQNALIQITVLFREALECDPEVHGFRLSQAGQGAPEYVAVDVDGQSCAGYGRNPKRVSGQMRAEVALLFLSLDRQSEQQVRPTQWTLYGKLLKRIETTIAVAAKSQFSAEVGNSVNAHIRGSLNQAQQIIDDFVRRQTGLNIQLDFRVIDPLEVLKGVRPFVLEGALSSDPNDVGAGVQSALAVAIAKAYADIVRQSLVLAIEEPELYLHPHGCRHFYRLLRELSREGLQIIYATHERSFVDAGHFEGIHIVRKPQGVTQVSSGTALNLGANRGRLELQSRFNERVNEVFFATCVVLVEGEVDEVAIRCALERQGLELDRKSISVMPLGGKGELPIVGELLLSLQIPTVAVLDEDPGDATTARVRQSIQQLLGCSKCFLTGPKPRDSFWPHAEAQSS